MWARPWGRSAWAARRTGRRRPARCLRGPRGSLGRCARACCWRRCSRCCAAACTRRFIAAKRGPACPQGANGGAGNRRKLFFKPEPPFADGAKDRKMNKRRGLHGRAVFVPGGQPQSGERDAAAGLTGCLHRGVLPPQCVLYVVSAYGKCALASVRRTGSYLWTEYRK